MLPPKDRDQIGPAAGGSGSLGALRMIPDAAETGQEQPPGSFPASSDSDLVSGDVARIIGRVKIRGCLMPTSLH